MGASQVTNTNRVEWLQKLLPGIELANATPEAIADGVYGLISSQVDEAIAEGAGEGDAAATPDTLALRDAEGDLHAVDFTGTSATLSGAAAAGSLVAPTLDRASSGALQIGGTNTTTLDLRCSGSLTKREGTTVVCTETLDADGACSIVYAATVTSLGISIAQAASGVGKPITIGPSLGAAGSLGGAVSLDSGPAVGGVSEYTRIKYGGSNLLGIRTVNGASECEINLLGGHVFNIIPHASLESIWQGGFLRFDGRGINLSTGGSIRSVSLAITSSAGAAAWNVATSGARNAHIIASENTTLTITPPASANTDLELEFVPGGSMRTLTLSGVVFPSTPASQDQSALTTLCGTATRILLFFRCKRGVCYLKSFQGYSA